MKKLNINRFFTQKLMFTSTTHYNKIPMGLRDWGYMRFICWTYIEFGSN
jgi:hypothetical protein